MIDAIYSDPELHALIRQECFENQIGVTPDPALCDSDGFWDHTRVVALKVDAYYSTMNMATPPKSPDYVVIVKCEDNTFDLYVIELRNVAKTKGIKRKDIEAKFLTVFTDFFTVRFPHIFLNPGLGKFNKVRLYLVTDPLGLKKRNLTEAEIKEYFTGTVLDAFSNLEPIQFIGRNFLIEPKLPNPTIVKC